MCAKMWHVSEQVSALPAADTETARARMDLYRGQCNCGYWHGVFGGLYLPHLRDAVYRKLISAEAIACRAKSRKRLRLRSEEQDLDMDGHREAFISNGLLNCYLAPARGGHLYELDIADSQFNAMNTFTRRREAYHSKVAIARVVDNIDQVETIHNLVLAKQPGLEAALLYDWYERESLVDHFIAPEATLQQFCESRYGEEGDFVNGQYSLDLAGDRSSIAATLRRRGRVARVGAYWPLEIEKTARLPNSSRALQVRYRLRNEADNPLVCRFGVEFNFSMLAGDREDRYYYWNEAPDTPSPSGNRSTPHTERQHTSLLNARNDIAGASLFGIVDRWQKLDIELRFKRPAAIWTFPVQTVSQSEAGFELIYQSTAVVPIWTLSLMPREWTVLDLILTVRDLEKP
jgi:alpha-amylase